jgi:PAS domain S-box-containing protein
MSELFKTMVDQDHVRRLLGSIQQATGIPVSLLGTNGELLATAGWNDLCRFFHSQTDLGQKQCRATRNYFSGAFTDSDSNLVSAPVERHCQNGLIEIGLPVIVDDQHYASLVFGQFMPKNCDREKFRQRAVAMEIDQVSYMDAVDSAPVIDRAVVQKLLSVYSGVIDVLVRIGLQHLEQKQIAEEIRASEEKFRALFDHSNDSIYIIDLDGMILEANQLTCDRLGFSHAELCTMHVSGLGDVSHMMEVDGRLRRFKKEGRLFFETNHRCKDGTLIPVEVNGKVIDYGDGEAILCTARDLSRRYAAQRALKQSEEQFRSIINSSPMGVLLYRCDDAGRLLLVGSNPSADEILGVKTANMHGMTMEEAFPALSRTDLPQIYRRVCRDGERYFIDNLEYEDGNLKGIFEVHAFQTALNQMAVFFMDVTARIHADQALRESEEKYRLLFSAEKDAILICDNASLQLTDANDAAALLYGYDHDRLVGLNVVELLAESEQVRDDLETILSGESEILSSIHRRQDGTLFPVEITAGVFDWTGRRLLVLIVRDASEREKISRMKDEMLSSVSHEMRTPLTAMLGYTELLLSDNVEAEQRQQFLKTIYREGERLRELVDDLLDLQRLRAGFSGNQLGGVDISLLLYEVASLFNETARQHSIEVLCAPDLGLIIADSNKIHRALKNLLTNAIKFSPAGGKVNLSAVLIEDGKMVRIAVQDFGLGVPDAVREKLFDRFFRVCQPEVKNLSGAGIGLSLVREIARMHGGSIWFDSVHGQGSTFNLDLPVAGAPAVKGEGLS